MNTEKNKSLLDPKTAQEIIFEGLSQGADFVDVFIEENKSQKIEFESKKIAQLQTGIDFGVGIRLIYGHHALYSYTNSTNKNDLLQLVQEMKKEGSPKPKKIDFKENKNPYVVPYFGLKKTSLEEQIQFIQKTDQKIRAQSEKIIQNTVRTLVREQNVEVFNSEGLHIQDLRPYCRLFINAVSQDGSFRSTSMHAPGGLGGWDFIQSLEMESIIDQVVRSALTMLYAESCPAGNFPVVLANGFGGVIFHEACGHPLETTAVSKKSSVFWDKMGEMIAHEAVSAVDDGTMDHLWGSLSYDDEGFKTQKTQLIKNGRLENFLSDRMGELQTGYKRTGSGRKESYKYAPASRMRNTYIEAGKNTLDEMISSIQDGLYAAQLGGGSVSPGTGEFNFSVVEGYLIKNGKISSPVKGATLIGRGQEILKNISMVGKDLSLSAGMCGSVSGMIPTTVGQPSLKVDQILVGGKSS